jgi:hypothetical protein
MGRGWVAACHGNTQFATFMISPFVVQWVRSVEYENHAAMTAYLRCQSNKHLGSRRLLILTVHTYGLYDANKLRLRYPIRGSTRGRVPCLEPGPPILAWCNTRNPSSTPSSRRSKRGVSGSFRFGFETTNSLSRAQPSDPCFVLHPTSVPNTKQRKAGVNASFRIGFETI